MKKTLLLALAFTTAGAYAQTTTTTSTASTEEAVKKVEKSPFGLRLIDQIGTDYGDGKLAGLGNDLYITPSYKINDKWSMNFDNLLQQYYDKEAGEVSNQYTYATLNLYRSGLLNEKEHGVSLSANARYRLYVKRLVDEHTTPAYGRVGLTVSKSFTPKFNAYLSTQFAVYQRTTGGEGMSATYLYPILGLSYSISDKWSVGLTGEYLKYFSKNEGQRYSSGKNLGKMIYDNEQAFLTLEAGYQATSKLGIGASIAGKIGDAHDGVNQFDDLHKNLNLSVSATYTVF